MSDIDHPANPRQSAIVSQTDKRRVLALRGWQGLLLLSLVAIQLTWLSFIAVKYIHERRACPRVWTRAAALDRSLLADGHSLRLQLVVDGCQSTLPSAKQAVFGRNVDGSANASPYAIAGPGAVSFIARLMVRDNKLLAIRIPDGDKPAYGETVVALQGSSCQQMLLAHPVEVYLPDRGGAELAGEDVNLWIEVMVPPAGQPRPLRAAMDQRGVWKALEIR